MQPKRQSALTFPLENCMSESKPKITTLSHEQAYDVIGVMFEITDYSTDEVTVKHGRHPNLGVVYVIIPPSGNSLLLPCAIQRFNV